MIELGQQRSGDALAPGQHLSDGRPGQEATLRSGVPFAHRLVVAVEQVAPAAIGAVVALQLAQQELFKEPGGVGEVPLRWARVGHPLQAEVLRLQARDQLLGRPADFLQTRQDCGS